jgi:hypothetical protein
MDRQTNVDTSYWSYQNLEDYPHMLYFLHVGCCPSTCPDFEQLSQQCTRGLLLVVLIPLKFESRSVPIDQDLHIVLTHREPRIVLLECADVDRHVLCWFEDQGLVVSNLLDHDNGFDRSVGESVHA